MILAAAMIGMSGAGAKAAMKFDLGTGPAAPGVVHVIPSMLFSKEAGYGFEPGSTIAAVNGGAVTAAVPFSFSVAVPEGNYRVALTLGDPGGDSNTTVKAELRRLMLENIKTSNGQVVRHTIVVNTRTPRISTGGEVRLKDREKNEEWPAWDEKLTIEFAGERPCVSAIEIERADDLPTVYLLGDSTICDQPSEPWASWGQMLPRFLKPGIAVANHAESGESARNSLRARRLDKVLDLIKPGDYLFMQFGHNDMKERGEGIGAFTSYKSDLLHYVTEIRKKGATPVLVTSCERKAGVTSDTLRDYPDAVRALAKEQDVALVDLHAMSKTLYRALGDDLDKAFQDGTHHNNYGAYELAKCVVESIRRSKLELAKFIVEDFSRFDPAHPDAPESLRIAPSARRAATPPLGN
jgi:lysophospholipase L1-like esterase